LDEDDTDGAVSRALPDRSRSAFSYTSGELDRSEIAAAVSASSESLSVQKLQAELEVAEAELKAARLKYQYIQAKEADELSGTSHAA